MPYIYKIATLNIKGITSNTKIQMLEEFLVKQDIDIALLQEVTNQHLHKIRRYTIYINEGTERRGTAIVVKEGITLNDIKRIPSGRGIAAKFNGTWIVNIYAPSGTEKKQEREHFYNSELTYILPMTYAEIILAGDFNCILTKTDSTGTKNYSRALANIVNGVGLIDAWEATTTSGRYTHYTANGASRIDRIYATKEIMERKTGIQTTAAAFTDHNAVIMRITIDTPPTRGRGYWRLNTALMREKSHIDTLQEQWEKWRTHKKHYPNSVMWWDRYTKRMIKNYS